MVFRCPDQNEAAKRYWRSNLELLGNSCVNITLTEGLVLKSWQTGNYVEVERSFEVEIATRGSKNYDNQREVTSHKKGKYWVVVKGKILPDGATFEGNSPVNIFEDFV